jgi:hypothetical protein
MQRLGKRFQIYIILDLVLDPPKREGLSEVEILVFHFLGGHEAKLVQSLCESEGIYRLK